MVVIYGRDVPDYTRDENTKAIALTLILNLSGVDVKDSHVKDCHRMGRKILVRFVHSGTCSPISRILFAKRTMHKKGTWINIHQCPTDRNLSYLARQMKKAGILEFVGTTTSGLARVGKDGQKFTIKTEDDLQQMTSQPLSSFLKGAADLNDSALSMEN